LLVFVSYIAGKVLEVSAQKVLVRRRIGASLAPVDYTGLLMTTRSKK
jgi:hypothetical protein